jgi:adenylate cyclase
MGIGISSGEAIAGEFGPPIRTDFTAMGRVMNLGARLCSAAGAKQIVISENTYEDLKTIADVDKMNPVPLKGISRQVDTYLLKKLTE